MSNTNGSKPNKFFGQLPQQCPVSPADAKKILQNRRPPANIVKVVNNPGEIKSLVLGGGNPLGIPSIPEQARALRNDVDLIYQYVHDNVDFIPSYGLQKGGLGALIDGSGNAFDQCDLMVKLLQNSTPAYTCQFYVGEILLDADQWSSWLRIDESNLFGALQLLANGGIPCTGYPETNQISMSHCWVQVTIDGTDYYFDPALKTLTTTAGIDLPSAMNYTYDGSGQPTFLDDAKSGATIAPGLSVANINAANINSDLSTYTANLLSWIRNNNPGATFDEILGGWSIVPTPDNIRNTSLPYVTEVDWTGTDLRDNYGAWFEFQYDAKSGGGYNVDVSFYTADIYGQRFTLWWNSSNEAQVWMAGTQYGGTSVAKAAGEIEDANFSINYPYGSEFANVTSSSQIQGQAPTFIGVAIGVASNQLAGIHQEFQNEYFAAGDASNSETLLGTSLNLIWDNLVGESSYGLDILARMGSAETVLHFFMGTVAQVTKPGTSTLIKSVSGFSAGFSTSALVEDVDTTPTAFATSLLMQSLAGTASQQVTGVECGDPITMISQCNQLGKTIYNATSSNWSTVSSALTTAGFTTTVQNDIDSWLNLTGETWRAIVPNDPAIAIGSFTDFSGYIPLTADLSQLYTVTWFDANGSASPAGQGAASAAGQDDPTTNSAAFGNARQVNGFGMPAVTATESARVNMLTGRYEYSSTDLTVGNQGAPYELAFTRSYNSALYLTLSKVSTGDNGLGYGWTHNWLMTAGVNSDGFIPFGYQQVSAAAPAIVSLFVMADVVAADTTMPVENFVTECEVATFLVNQLTNNIVRVQAGGSTLLFTLMPDGTYLPPLGASGQSLLQLLGTAPNQYFQYTSPDKVVYVYAPAGQISTITYPYGITITFTYTSGQLSKVSNGFRSLNFTYDSYGQLNTINDGNGRTVTLTIPTTGTNASLLTAVKDPLGNTTTYTYVANERGLIYQVFKPANPSSPIFTNTYDTLNRVKQQTDAYGNVWQFFFAGTRSEELSPNNTSRILYFNNMGNPVLTIDALGNAVSTEYDGNQRVILQTLPEGNSIATTYDADGNKLTVTQQAKPGSPLAARTKSYTYETTWNKVASATDFGGNTTTFQYVPPGTNGASCTQQITGPTVPAGTPMTQFQYNSIGQLTQTTDPTGVVTVNAYDPSTNNLLSQTVDPRPGLNIRTQFTYDSVGNVLSTTDPNGNTATNVYDVLRRVTQVTGPAPFNQVSLITYDANSNITQTQSLASTDPNSQIAQATYSIDSKVLTVIGPANFPQGAQPVPTVYQYDNQRRLVQVTDPLGHVATTVYDALSRPSSSAIDGVTQNALSYTDNGLLLSITDANSNTTQYQYDGFDRTSLTTYPDASFQEPSYDILDNVLEVITRAGDTFNFTYDAASQLLTKTPAGLATVTFTYDLAGRPLTIATPEVPGDPSTGTFSFAYDTAGRRIQEQYPDGKTVSVSMDLNGNPVRLTYPDGSQVANVFDQLNRFTSVAGFGGKVTFGYDSASRCASKTNGNTTGQGYRYDKVDSLLSMTIGGLEPNVSLPLSPRIDFAYSFNDSAENTGRSCSNSSLIWYPQVSSTSTYGSANNINQYPSVDSLPFSYDGNGCLTSDGVNSYGYDSESRLISVVTPANTVNYEYDPLGRLALKTVGTSTVRYLYAGLQRIEEYDGDSGNLLRRYVYGAGLDECLFVIDATTGDISYLHPDERGSTILITDASGTPSQSNVFAPWGELSSGSLSYIGIGFTGQFYDQDAGLYYFKARHYSPWLGRFLQPDPAGYVGGLNLYEYCSSDPVNFTDPLGLDDDDDDSVPLVPTGSFPAFYANLVPTYTGPGGGGGGLNGYGYGVSDAGSPITNIFVLTALAEQAFAAAEYANNLAAQAAQAAQAAAIAAAQRAAEMKLLGQSVDSSKIPLSAAASPFLAIAGKILTRGPGGSASIASSLIEGGNYLHIPTGYVGWTVNFVRRFAEHGKAAAEFIRLPMANARNNVLPGLIRETQAIAAKGGTAAKGSPGWPNVRWPISVQRWTKLNLPGQHPGLHLFYLDLGAELFYMMLTRVVRA